MGRKNLTREQFAQHEPLARRIRKEMIATFAALKSKDVAIPLSAGVDSHACLFAAIAAGKTPTCYSFAFRDQVSTDFKIARQTAQQFGLPFVPVELPRNGRKLQQYVLDVFHNYARTIDVHVNKSSVECLFPLLTMLDKIKQNGHAATVIGFGGDAPFCSTRIQKKRLLAGEYEQWRQEYFDANVKTRREVQTLIMDEWCRQHNPRHKIIIPFHEARVFNLFRGMGPFDPGCKPIQKAPVRLAFYDEIFRTHVLVHSNLQQGDSGIGDHFDKVLMASSWNNRGAKSVKAIYNDVELNVITKV